MHDAPEKADASDMRQLCIVLGLSMVLGCGPAHKIAFRCIDTDFSKGRLTHAQTLGLDDLVKFHGHLCDGLVVGALGMQQAMKTLYPGTPIDRTNLRIVSKPSPCLTDVAIYLTGARYQFSTFFADSSFAGIYIVQRIDNGMAVSVRLNDGVKPAEIDSLGRFATAQTLSPCGLDSLRRLEDAFTAELLAADPDAIFSTQLLQDFQWTFKNNTGFTKTDVLNKAAGQCVK